MSINSNPYLYGFTDSYTDYEDDYEELFEFSEIDRNLYLVEEQEEWNTFVRQCDLNYLWFIDEHWEIISLSIERIGSFVITDDECDIFNEYRYFKFLYEEADMSFPMSNEMLGHIQECQSFFGEEFEDILEYGKRVKKVHYDMKQLIKEIQRWNHNDISYNSFCHYFYESNYEDYIEWCCRRLGVV